MVQTFLHLHFDLRKTFRMVAVTCESAKTFSTALISLKSMI